MVKLIQSDCAVGIFLEPELHRMQFRLLQRRALKFFPLKDFSRGSMSKLGLEQMALLDPQLFLRLSMEPLAVVSVFVLTAKRMVGEQQLVHLHHLRILMTVIISVLELNMKAGL
jgi:hypothetical protein